MPNVTHHLRTGGAALDEEQSPSAHWFEYTARVRESQRAGLVEAVVA